MGLIWLIIGEIISGVRLTLCDPKLTFDATGLCSGPG